MISSVNYSIILGELRQLSENEIYEKIEAYYRRVGYGEDFLEKLSMTAFLNSLTETGDLNLDKVQKYCNTKLSSIKRDHSIKKILGSWQAWGIAIATIGLFVIELFRFLHEICCCH